MLKITLWSIFLLVLIVQISARNSGETSEEGSAKNSGESSEEGSGDPNGPLLSGTRDRFGSTNRLVKKALRVVDENFRGHRSLRFRTAIDGVPKAIKRELVSTRYYKRNLVVKKSLVKQLIRDVAEDTSNLFLEGILPITLPPAVNTLIPTNVLNAINNLIKVATDKNLAPADKAVKIVDSVATIISAVGPNKPGVQVAARIVRDVADIIRVSTAKGATAASIYGGVIKAVKDIVSAVAPNSPALTKVTTILDETVSMVTMATSNNPLDTKVNSIFDDVNNIIKAAGV